MVSSIGLGVMPLAIQKRPEEGDAIRLIHAALDAGIDWVDTADSYCLDESDFGYGERLVRRALEQWGGPRDKVLVTTKGGWVRPGGEWAIDARPAQLRAACEASLKALGVPSIFLYQLHAPDPKVYWPDSVGAVAELKREGKIQHVGISNVDVGHIKDAEAIVEVATVQNRCNVFDRFSFVNGVVDHCQARGIAFIAHSPIGGHHGVARTTADPVLRAVGERHGLTPQQVALLWLLEGSPGLLPIPGAKRLENLQANIAAAERQLGPADLAELAAAFPKGNFPRQPLVRLRDEMRRIVRHVRHDGIRATLRELSR
jgi:aryl-alcohol dehydrogenase-like predicted oxidoreductase